MCMYVCVCITFEKLCMCIRDLTGVADTPETILPLLFIDTAGCDLMEMDSDSEQSKGNEGCQFLLVVYRGHLHACVADAMVSLPPGEADVVLHHLKLLLSNGVCPQDIAIIAPYNLQVLYAFSFICFLAYICVCLCMHVCGEGLTYGVIFCVNRHKKKVVECCKIMINHSCFLLVLI